MKLLLLAVAGLVAAEDWAVIVAGSSGYDNYRHQADACHAYQIVHKNGIPDERVIMMYYDDIAKSVSNPYKGKIFNKPTAKGTAGVDVYEGCPKHYTGLAVTPENFVNVLTGKANATKGLPVLKSTSNDRVFVNFVDHGASGLIAFPHGQLTSSQLKAALTTMHDNKMYSQLVFYLEACESGSMFAGQLSSSLSIYATTAANAVESSWGTYCPPDDKVDGKELNSCLGDLYSVNWMENTDQTGVTETLQQQYAIVKQTTNLSHVMQYGDQSFVSSPIGNFLGDTKSQAIVDEKRDTEPGLRSAVRSRDIPLHLAYYRYLRADSNDVEGRKTLALDFQQQLTAQIKADEMFMSLSSKLMRGNEKGKQLFFAPGPAVIGDCDCCVQARRAYETSCGAFTDYTLQYVRILNNACAMAGTEAVVNLLQTLC